MKTTAYFEQKLLERPEIRREWCQQVIENPIKEVQPDERVRYRGIITDYGNKVLRVVTLEDRETIHNAFFDRNTKRYQQEQR